MLMNSEITELLNYKLNYTSSKFLQVTVEKQAAHFKLPGFPEIVNRSEMLQMPRYA